MDSQQEAVLRLVQEENAERRREEQYERDCRNVLHGYLSAVDVCRLFASGDVDWSGGPGAHARHLVGEKRLPLLEIGPGKFVVGHTVSVPTEAG